MPQSPPQSTQAVLAFVNASSWTERKAIVETRDRELLTEAVEQVFATLIEQAAGDVDASCSLEYHRTVLACCRREGINAIFTKQSELDQLRTLLKQIKQLSKPEDIPRRLELCQTVLILVDRTQQPDLYAKLQLILAGSFAEYRLGKRADNIEQAIMAYKQALRIITHQTMPGDWAAIMNNLGTAYAKRIKGNRAENIEQAIDIFRQTLQVTMSQGMLIHSARTMANLANAHLARIWGDRADNIELAIRGYGKALQIIDHRNMPIEWATLIHNLASAYLHRLRGNRADNVERAIKAINQALEVHTRETLPNDWAATMTSLGTAYAQRIHGNRTDNLKQAVKAFDQALQIRTPAQPAGRCQTLSYLGDLHFSERNWEEAYTAYFGAIVASDTILETVFTETDRQTEVSKTWRLHARAAHCLLQLKEWNEALIQLEQGKTRLLTGSMGLDNIDMATLSDTQRQAIQDVQQATHELESEMHFLYDTNTHRINRDIIKALRKARAELNQIIGIARTEYSARQPHLNLPGIMDLIPVGGALVAPLVTSQGSAVFVLPHGTKTVEAEHIIWLNDFTDSELNALLIGSEDRPGWVRVYTTPNSGDTNAGQWSIEMLTGQLWEQMKEQAHKRLATWDVTESDTASDPAETGKWPETIETLTSQLWDKMREQVHERLATWDLTESDTVSDSAETGKWPEAIETFTNQLWKILMGPVHERLTTMGLAKDAPVILIPQGGLGLLPLQATWRSVDGHKRTFLDDYTVTYTPSAYALSVSQRRLQKQSERDHQPSLEAVINPTTDLLFTLIEGKNVATLFPSKNCLMLVEREATSEALIKEVSRYTYLHFACHGFYQWHDVMRSGLLLADRTPLTITEIISKLDLSTVRLVTLSACATGLTEFRQMPDEYIGLPAGFLQAGASGVISTLWVVNDLSTALLMEQFYHHHLKEEMSPAAALRQAQIWLRDELTLGEVMAYIERQKDWVWQSDWELYRGLETTRRWLLAQYGNNESIRPFAHPYYWAAFTMTGV